MSRRGTRGICLLLGILNRAGRFVLSAFNAPTPIPKRQWRKDHSRQGGPKGLGSPFEHVNTISEHDCDNRWHEHSKQQGNGVRIESPRGSFANPCEKATRNSRVSSLLERRRDGRPKAVLGIYPIHDSPHYQRPKEPSAIVVMLVDNLADQYRSLIECCPSWVIIRHKDSRVDRTGS